MSCNGVRQYHDRNSETQVSGRLGMSGGISPRHAQNPLSGERRKTLSITHHALSPPPSHHLFIIHLINWLQRFYRIIMSLKRPFVPKSDVKQWFTTTTTTTEDVLYIKKWTCLGNLHSASLRYDQLPCQLVMADKMPPWEPFVNALFFCWLLYACPFWLSLPPLMYELASATTQIGMPFIFQFPKCIDQS